MIPTTSCGREPRLATLSYASSEMPSMACGHVRYSCRRTHSWCCTSVYMYYNLAGPYNARRYIIVRAPGGLLCMCSAGHPQFDGTSYVYVLLIKPIISS